MSDDIRYIKQLKSRYNEIVFHHDNVVTIQFCTKADGLKGFRFLGYESEEELIKQYDRATKSEEDNEIINLIIHFGMKPAQIAEELHGKYAPDVNINTYKERIKKRVQRLKAKGLIEPDTEKRQTEKKVMMNNNNIEVSEKSVIKPPPTNGFATKINQESSLEITERICKELGIKTEREKKEEEVKLAWEELKLDLVNIAAKSSNITDNYDDIPI